MIIDTFPSIMKYAQKTAIIALLGLIISCSQETSTTSQSSEPEALNTQIEALKNAAGFDKREDVFEYQLDTTAENKVLFTVLTTHPGLYEKAVELAREKRFSKSEIITLPDDPQLQATPYGVVSQSVANMRVGQSRAKGMATQTLMGQELKLLQVDEDGFWHQVRSAQGYIAWIPKPSFEYLTQAQADSLRALPKVMVTAHTTFAYEPDNKKRVVTDLVYGNVLTLIKKGRKYTEVMIPGGRSALVKSSEVQSLDDWQQQAKFDEAHLIDFAYNFNGQPYLWGGNSMKGVDCSGFSGAVYYSMGMFLPRDASQQVKQGDDVPYTVKAVEVNGTSYQTMETDELKVGDLLFFGNKDKGSVTHVGIWIGNDEFIHSSGRVHVTSVDPTRDNYEDNYVERLVGVKRIHGSNNLDKTTDLTKTNIWY